MGHVFGFASVYRVCARLVALCAVFTVAACAGAPEPVTNIPHTSSFVTSTTPAYLIRSDDKLKLLVFGQDAISGDYTVTKDGNIDVAQVGPIQAAGLTVDQLKQQVTEKLRNGHVESPQVSILLDVDKPLSVTGAVINPGLFPFQPGLDAGSAVALAGGYSTSADTRTILVTHAGTTTEKRYGLKDRPVINPGDVIRIPDRG